MDEDENSDVPSSVSEILPVLRDFQEKVPEIIAHVKRLQLVASDLDYSTKNGVSLLELKCHLLLDYLINLVFLMLNKMQGQLIAGTSPIDRLIELRVVLEKIRPLDHKFQYQIDKLIKAGAAATTTDDPLNFKPNPNNFIHKIQDVSSDEDESGRGTAVYVPPKVVATPYVEDTESKRTTRHHKNQPRLTTSTNLMEELRGEYSEAPQEFATAPSSLRRRRDLIEEKEQEE
jgi:U3 small nucleolar ribonucleoprotein protein LCP5